jgi:hypothetical protein
MAGGSNSGNKNVGMAASKCCIPARLLTAKDLEVMPLKEWPVVVYGRHHAATQFQPLPPNNLACKLLANRPQNAHGRF